MKGSNEEVECERKGGGGKEEVEMKRGLVWLDDGHITSQALIFYWAWAVSEKDGAEKKKSVEEGRRGDRKEGIKIKKIKEGSTGNRKERER